MPDGTAYLNTKTAWKMLGEASKAVRYLGLVPIDVFEDRRNPPVMIFAPQPARRSAFDDDRFHAFASRGFVHAVLLEDMPEYGLPSYAISGDVDQRYHIELWCEKSTMNDVLVPLCRSNACNLVTGLGEMSISSVRDLIRRIANIGSRPGCSTSPTSTRGASRCRSASPARRNG